MLRAFRNHFLEETGGYIFNPGCRFFSSEWSRTAGVLPKKNKKNGCNISAATL
jgi:hypothetical protein